MQVFSTTPAAWAPAVSHEGAVRNAVRRMSKVLLQGGHSSTETWKSPWGLGKDQARWTGRFGKPRRGGEGSLRGRTKEEDHTGRRRETGREVLTTPTYQSGWA